jgi:hypothetical protein
MKYSTIRLEETSDQEGRMPKCHSFEKRFVQPSPLEDLEVWPLGVNATGAQVHPLN